MSAQTCPFEILDYIFLLTIQTPEDRLILPHLPKYTPWAVRQVGSSWRKAAIAQRKLWDTVVFEIPEDADDYGWHEPDIQRGIREKSFSRLLNLATSIMPQTGPLCIGIQHRLEYIDPDVLSLGVEFFTQKFVPRVKAFSLRCPLVGLRTFFGLPAHTLIGCISLEITALEDYDYNPRERDPNYIKNSSILQDISSLRSLVFNGGDFLWSIPDLKLPWEQLTSLVIVEEKGYSIHFPHIGPILRACQALEYYKIVAPGHFELEPPNQIVYQFIDVVLERLRFFTLHTDFKWKSTLDQFMLPALETFELDCSWFPCKTVARMLSRSSSPLKVLRAGTFFRPFPEGRQPLRPECLEILSDATPSLQVLETDSLLDLPSIEGIASGRWFPGLTTLSCHTNLDPLTFSDVLLPRFGNSGPNGSIGLAKVSCVSYRHNGISKADMEEESKRVMAQHRTELVLSLHSRLEFAETELHPRPIPGALAAKAAAEFTSSRAQPYKLQQNKKTPEQRLRVMTWIEVAVIPKAHEEIHPVTADEDEGEENDNPKLDYYETDESEYD